MSTRISDIMVTPDIAADLLSQNTKNRPLSKSVVSKYARFMVMGKWLFNGDTITRSNGVIVDGQHRLAAIVKSGMTIRCIIVDGVDDGAFATKDAGKVRSSSDLLAIAGFKDTCTLGAAANTAMCIVEMQETDSLAFWRTRSNALVLEWVGKNTGIIEHINCYTNNQKTPGRRAAKIAISYIYSLHGIDVSGFMDQVNSGIGLSKTDPAYHLREYLIRRRDPGGSPERRRECAMFIKSINAHIKGTPMKLLKFLDEEKFPTIQAR